MSTNRPEASVVEALDEDTLHRREDRRDRWLTVGTFASLLGLWAAVTGSGLWEPLIKPLFLPSPVAVWEALLRLIEQGYQGRSLGHHVGVSFQRFATAFSFCVLIGVPLGLLMGMHRPTRAVLEPPIQAIRPIPKLALLPLFLIWFGIGNLSKIVVIAAPVFPLIAISAMQAVRSVSTRKIQAAQALGASPWVVFWRVVLPASLPGIFTGIRVSISLGVTMLVGVLIMAAMGYSLDRLVRALETRLVHWSGKD